jgi:hypothetical protein
MSESLKYMYDHNRGERTIRLRVFNRVTGKMIRSTQHQFDTPEQAWDKFLEMERGGEPIGA